MREQHAQNTKNRDIRHDKRRNCRKESIQMDLNFRNKLIWKRSKRLGNNLGKGTILVTSYFFTFTYCTYDCDAFLIRRRNSTISTCPSLEIFIPQCLAVIICTYLTHARSKYAMTMTQDFSNNHPLSTVGEYYAETTRGLLKTTPVIYQPFWTPLSAGIPPPTHAVCSKLIYLQPSSQRSLDCTRHINTNPKLDATPLGELQWSQALQLSMYLRWKIEFHHQQSSNSRETRGAIIRIITNIMSGEGEGGRPKKRNKREKSGEKFDKKKA
jgi:hypothetical protein